ncbi:MAG: threonine--tRNA ligase [Candidatus Omnitrophica bacterium]|nr:threonine--tRNA ligase [Candidatus Omnitrophota bacterium]
MDYSKDIDKLRHTCAHVMAQAVQELWPQTKVTIGPAIETGFYYDFDRKEPFTDEDLKTIEKRMAQIISQKFPMTKEVWPRGKAIEYFLSKGETYKVELIEALLADEEISVYKTGQAWLDLCKGPHVEHAGLIKAFKLLSVAGAYWHGDEKKPMLQRIYGTAFFTKPELDEYLKMLEEAAKRDHRKLATQLDLFHVYHETAGAGLVFYHPNGAMLRKIIEDYVRAQHLKHGYQLVMTPHMLKGKLWEVSGHAEHYQQNMYYFKVDDEDYAVKPMNCPGHMLIYKSQLRSYRDLPIRYFELGTVYRQEKAGVLHGLLRVRGFTQDDAHIFLRPDQIKEEVMSVLDFAFETMKDFGFEDLCIELSTRPQDFIGSQENWDKATKSLKEALDAKKIKYDINEGEGAFYGPKIDIKLKDAIGRFWQCGTIQCDFALPERFDLHYIDEQGRQARPIMVHRAILGSLERFIGTLIEHYAGHFPLWLAPRQIVVIPIKPDHQGFAEEIKKTLVDEGFRVTVDSRNESLSKRIREAAVQKIPYQIVIGDKEASSQMLAVRSHSDGDLGSMSPQDLLGRLKQQVIDKK